MGNGRNSESPLISRMGADQPTWSTRDDSRDPRRLAVPGSFHFTAFFHSRPCL